MALAPHPAEVFRFVTLEKAEERAVGIDVATDSALTLVGGFSNDLARFLAERWSKRDISLETTDVPRDATVASARSLVAAAAKKADITGYQAALLLAVGGASSAVVTRTAERALRLHWVASQKQGSRFDGWKWSEVEARTVFTTDKPPAATTTTLARDEAPALTNHLGELRDLTAAIGRDHVVSEELLRTLAPTLRNALERNVRPGVDTLGGILDRVATTPDPNGGSPPGAIPGLIPFQVPRLFPEFGGLTIWPFPQLFVPAEPIGKITAVQRGMLRVVQQRLRGYRISEISHVENVFATEVRTREHRTLRREEITEVSETEREEEQEHDLKSTTRSELDSEISSLLREDRKLEAGGKVAAKFGEYVSVEGHVDYADERHKEEATKSAQRHVMEVAQRALSRIRQRVREERTTRLLHEVEEKNSHSIGTAESHKHIRGFYRWLEKINELVLHTYGVRTVYSFTVPDPAAQYLATKAAQAADQTPPAAPVAKDGKPLLPRHITKENYQQIGAQWGIAEIPQPPATTKTVSKTISGATKDTYDYAGTAELEVGDDWVCDTLRIAASATSIVPAHEEFRDNDKEKKFMVPETPGLPFPFFVPPRVSVNIAGQHLELNGVHEMSVDELGPKISVAAHTWGGSFSLEVTAICSLRSEATVKWQHEVYAKVMGAFLKRLEQYNADVRAAAASASGPPPGARRKIIEDSLKRALVRVLTKGTTPALDVAAFLNRAFDWDSLAYTLLPYFFGGRAGAEAIEPSDDPDFDAFLRAGGATARLAVQPGFEEAVAIFVAGNGRQVPARIGVVPQEDISAVSTDEDVPPDVVVGEVIVPTSLIVVMNASEIKDVYQVDGKTELPLVDP